MKLFYCDEFAFPLPPNHRFPVDKYALLRRRLEAEWTEPGLELRVPPAAGVTELETVHDAAYVRRVFQGRLEPAELRRIGLPWSPELLERCCRSVGGTLEAARAALEDGVAASLAGGTHHAFSNRGEGFCVFNDTAVASRVLQREGRVDRVLIADCDVHQGNGTAAIFRADPSVFTLSIHGARNFPFRKEPGDLDIALEDGTEDDQYLAQLADALPTAFDRSRPDLVFFIAGADPFVGDALGRLALSKAGLGGRDRLVLDACRDRGVPVALVMGGGYARPIDDTVDIHYRTITTAAARHRAPTPA